MKRLSLLIGFLLISSAGFFSCQTENDVAPSMQVSNTVLTQLKNLGFDVNTFVPIHFDEGFLVENDEYVTLEDLNRMKPEDRVRIPQLEQYSTNFVVKATTPRNISVFIPGTFSAIYVAALDEAIARYNAEGLKLTFSRVDAFFPRPNIIIRRLPPAQERLGVTGSAAFPTSYGSPFGTIKMNGMLESDGWGVNEIATLMTHFIGHCIGLRHTDFFDRSISCGGEPFNEGNAGVGANHIPGTPVGATRRDMSFMLACFGGNRPFNADDKVALNYLY
jgi:hypothetical protein